MLNRVFNLFKIKTLNMHLLVESMSTQQGFTCSKLKMETPKQFVKSVLS